MTTEGGIAAVLFDLDDTLFPQASWLAGAWVAVADEAAYWGVDRCLLLQALNLTAAEGTGRGRIIDRALEAIGSEAPVDRLVAAFRAHRPNGLELYPGVRDALDRLAAVSRLGVVSDGETAIQAAKLAALGLDAMFDVVVLSDRLGRQHRKPDAAPFRLALDALRLPSARVVFVGDSPAKGVAGAKGVGMRAIRVHTGEYAGEANDPVPWMALPSAADVASVIVT